MSCLSPYMLPQVAPGRWSGMIWYVMSLPTLISTSTEDGHRRERSLQWAQMSNTSRLATVLPRPSESITVFPSRGTCLKSSGSVLGIKTTELMQTTPSWILRLHLSCPITLHLRLAHLSLYYTLSALEFLISIDCIFARLACTLLCKVSMGV